jgi:hypothetical protein
MDFHPKIKELFKFQDDIPICPFCDNVMARRENINNDKQILEHWYQCLECSKDIEILWDAVNFPNQLSTPLNMISYNLQINKKLKVSIDVYFDDNITMISFWDHTISPIKVPHTKFPFFNEMAMRHKLRIYLTFS